MTGRVGLRLVIAGDDPDLAPVFEANLRRAENVSGGMERNAHPIDVDRFPVGQGADSGARLETLAKHACARRGGEVRMAAPGHVVAVGVGHHRPIDGRPGVDVKVSSLAVEPAVGATKQGHRP